MPRQVKSDWARRRGVSAGYRSDLEDRRRYSEENHGLVSQARLDRERRFYALRAGDRVFGRVSRAGHDYVILEGDWGSGLVHVSEMSGSFRRKFDADDWWKASAVAYVMEVTDYEKLRLKLTMVPPDLPDHLRDAFKRKPLVDLDRDGAEA